MPAEEFTSEQRAHLANHGLLPEQISELEGQLQVARFWLKKPIRKEDVLRELSELQDALKKARNNITKLLRTSEHCPERKLALTHFHWAEFDICHEGTLEKLGHLLATAGAANTHAITRVKALAPQRHTKSGPVGLIEDALLNGFIKHYGADGMTMPPYLQTISTTENSKEIVATFYEAVGEPNFERALRNYLEYRHNAERRRRGMEPLKRKPGRPRKK